MALAIAAIYNDDFGRVQISFTGANIDADYARVEHSLDQVTWSTIRGGDKVSVSGGSGHVDHYDGYTFGVPNYYRVTAVDASPIDALTQGPFVKADNAAVSPGIPAGTVAGNVMVLTASHQNTAATITTPAGWTLLAGGASNMATFWRVYQAGDTAPSVAFSGGAAGQSCSAIIRSFTNAQPPVHAALQSNASAQDVAYPGASQPTLSGLVWLLQEWKQATGTGASLPVGFNADPWGGFNTAGASPESQITWRTLASSNVKTVTAFSNAWQGGTAAVSKARLMYLAPRVFTDQGSTSYTPVLPNKNTRPYWLMNPARPGQNIRIELTSFSEIQQDGRTGIFEIVGRSTPVTVSDIMGSGAFEFTIDADNKRAAKEIAARLALGDPMYLLVADANSDIDTCYFTALSLKRDKDAPRGSWSVTVSAREVSQPAPAVYGSTYIWSDVVSDYASWTAVVADPQNNTWANLVDRISTDVIIVS